MHQITGKSMIGLSLALTTAILWGMLPIALKVLLDVLTANTITAVRFFAAAVMVGLWLWLSGKLPKLRLLLSKKAGSLMIIAVLGLLSNYIMYLSGLNYLSAETGQVVIQLAPFLMMLGGVVIFKEQLLLWQKVGAFSLVAGLLLFFNERLVQLLQYAGSETLGVLLVIAAAVTWAAYALAQKQLLMHYSSKQIMYLLYVAGTVAFIPVSDFSPLQTMTALHWGLLVFCCLNTVVAYGAFAEALHHWEASKVSAVLAVTPLFTILFAQLLAWQLPDFISAQVLNIWSWIGAALVVLGSALTALAPQFADYRAARKAKKLQRDVF
ncbi:MAG: EamA family transporter [Alteromonadaceae bacterium]|jgi:drug/metabolite transporter (DMT)-like permease|uniref:DMT family transporter n=4 Tax=Rheinheimera aquimaris TaxID=412437 RepID=A0ABN1DEW5_9GAMM|nr:DMT family transporter [Rheinheimera aquimaris]MBJ92485.1 EamA family transporter [Alteromonadaceae bacterium]MCB5212132.1 DMT family transporter [Rheinheimera aquimaris]MCD1599417.1 DMT family transporter [Rheinheimera aquimaris]HBN88519.1 EamA family transporter [Rheinheimera sp.]|tara:strand:+ start:168 stop:1139 length:972 start_codon:yes stop_codon:yes gene_type:complete